MLNSRLEGCLKETKTQLEHQAHMEFGQRFSPESLTANLFSLDPLVKTPAPQPRPIAQRDSSSATEARPTAQRDSSSATESQVYDAECEKNKICALFEVS